MTHCKKCGKQIVFLKTVSGKHIPVNVDSMSFEEQTGLNAGFEIFFDRKQHKTHFAYCPYAKSFRKITASKNVPNLNV